MSELFKRALTSIPLIGGLIALAYSPFWLFIGCIALILALMLILEWPRFFSPSSIYFWVIMPFYPLLPFIALTALHYSYGPIIIVFLFGLAGIHDTGSYIAGKLWGTYKIFPAISPGKTAEGCIGGFLATLMWVSILFKSTSSWTLTIAWAFIFTLTALTGDLFESALKRAAGIKHSGNLLPGHGGLFDRFDSLMFVALIAFTTRHILIPLIRTSLL